MAKKPIILGIETSCDETAVSLIQDDEGGVPKILSNVISSQFDIHKDLNIPLILCSQFWRILGG